MEALWIRKWLSVDNWIFLFYGRVVYVSEEFTLFVIEKDFVGLTGK